MTISVPAAWAARLDFPGLESLLDRDYLVLNCGTNGANLFNMTSEWAMRFLHVCRIPLDTLTGKHNLPVST